MRLSSFRVTNYKSIKDSGWIDLENLTVLVGKNESGKTSLLRALHKFNPFKTEPYSIDREWPRGRRQDRDPNAVVCSVRFALSEDEQAEVSQFADPGAASYLVEVQKTYLGNFQIHDPENHFPARPPLQRIQALLEQSGIRSMDMPAGPFLYRDEAADNILQCALRGSLTDVSEHYVARMLYPHAPSDGLPTSDMAVVVDYTTRVSTFRSALQSEKSVRDQVFDYVKARVPTFIYMDDYRAFRGTAQLNEVEARVREKRPTDEDRTLLTIMELAGLSLNDEFAKAQSSDINVKEQRAYDLNDAGISLSKQIAERWKQRRYEVQFRGDGNSFFTMVKDEQGTALIPLEDRSKGFQWFFSFDLMFMYESRGSFKGCVLLLDEPGLHLHPDAQSDLVERLEAYSNGNMLIYTTHLPFMIDLRRPERIRTISETDKGAVVDASLNLSQPAAKFTLQAALGMKASHSYLLAQKNLVVEGVDDFWLITELSNLAARSNLPALPDDVFITAAGGASEAAYVATFMIGQNLQVAALFDSDTSGTDASEKLIKTWLTSYKNTATQVLMVGKILGMQGDRASEDVFDDDFYIDRVMAVYGKALARIGVDKLSLQGSDQLVKRTERALAEHEIKFNKGSVAKKIRSDLRAMTRFDALPEQTQARAKSLLSALAAAFS